MLNRTIYTLGTSTRTLEEFMALLKHLEIEAVADVRRFPSSRLQYFKKEELARSLPEAGIHYCHLGAELGGYRKGGYPAFTTGEEFSLGLQKLEDIAKAKKTAIICAEKLPFRCHRRFIGAEMERKGWLVIHVVDEKHSWASRSQIF